jgi:excisionase family DNA binding protein
MGSPRPDERLLKVSEVADRCGLSPKAVRHAIRRGELRASRLCGQYRISEPDLRAWIEANVYRPRRDNDELGPPAPVTPPRIGSPAALRALEGGSPA